MHIYYLFIMPTFILEILANSKAPPHLSLIPVCVQVHFPARALTKEICVGLSVFPVPASELGTQAGAASPVVTVEPRRRKFHRPITVTMPLPQTTGSRHTANIETSLLVSSPC